jgi:hypothetical protein
MIELLKKDWNMVILLKENYLKFRKNYLFLAKIIFSILSLILVIFLNIFLEKQIAGQLLFTQSLVLLIAVGSRFGSDFYWVSSDSNFIKIYRYEVLFIAFLSMFIIGIMSIFIDNVTENAFSVVFLSVMNINFIYFLARCYQKNNEHIKSLFLFTLGPTVLIIPIQIFFPEINVLINILISTTILLVVMLLFFKPNININIETEFNVEERLNYFPMIIYGYFNQNILALYAGFINKEESIAVLILFQKISGFVLWPQIFHMQKQLQEIKEATTNVKVFKSYFHQYVSSIKYDLFIYLMISIALALVISIYYNTLGVNAFISFLLILLALIINLLLGYIKFQIGVTKNGKSFIFIMLASFSIVYLFSLLPFIEFISIASVLLIFSLVSHILGYYLLLRRLK